MFEAVGAGLDGGDGGAAVVVVVMVVTTSIGHKHAKNELVVHLAPVMPRVRH